MLIITRKPGEKIMLGDDVVVHVMEIVGNSVRVGIQAPRSLPVYREEIWDAVRQENEAAATAAPDALPTPARPAARPGLFPAPAGGYRLVARVPDPLRIEEQKLMAPTPFRRRKAATTVRNLAIAEAALAFAKDRALAAAPGRRSRRPSGRMLLLGGAVAAAGAAALLKREKVAGLLPSRAGEPEPYTPPAPPQQSNYDAPGPVANTATPVPAPDPQEQPPPAIDEQAEEAAAAAEAAAIGGTTTDYAGLEAGEPADEAERPLAEAGEGEAEGQEQAEAELAANAEYRDRGLSDAERQIEDTIEAAGRPTSGETPEPLASEDLGPASEETGAGQPGAQETFLPPEAPAPGDAQAAPEGDDSDADDSDDWRTWSGRSVKPS